MIYDFKTLVNRTDTGSVKWDYMKKLNPDITEDIVPYSVADMDLKTAPEIVEGLTKYISSNILGYTSPTRSYFDAVCGWMQKRHGWAIKPEWIMTYPGIVPAFFLAVKAFTEPGDGVIIMTPVYYPFYSASEDNGRTMVRNPLIKTDDRYEIDFDDLEIKARDPKNKLLIFCSPHNPVGRVWEKAELEKVADICLRNNVLILSDEIHNDLIMPGHRHTVFATVSEEAANQMIVCTAPSKTFNLAGLSTSNLIIPNADIRKIFRREAMTNAIRGVNCLGLKACEIAYTQCDDWLDQLNALIHHNHRELKKFFSENLPQVKVYNLEGTYLQWMDFNSLGLDKDALEKVMHMKAQVFLDEGYSFGEEGNGFERMNIACPTQTMMDGLKRILNAVK